MFHPYEYQIMGRAINDLVVKMERALTKETDERIKAIRGENLKPVYELLEKVKGAYHASV